MLCIKTKVPHRAVLPDVLADVGVPLAMKLAPVLQDGWQIGAEQGV